MSWSSVLVLSRRWCPTFLILHAVALKRAFTLQELRLLSVKKRRLKGRYINVYKYLEGECRGQSLALFTGTQWQDQRQRVQTGTREVLSARQEMPFPCVGDWALAQVAWGGAEVSHLGDVHMLSGCGAWQLAVGSLAGAGAWTRWLSEVPPNLNHCVILWMFPQEDAFTY